MLSRVKTLYPLVSQLLDKDLYHLLPVKHHYGEAEHFIQEPLKPDKGGEESLSSISSPELSEVGTSHINRFEYVRFT